jgi:deferrochelatase/peroxidase EfeB
MVDGFVRRTSTAPGEAPSRNLLGFKDGTANLRSDDPDAMARHVWVGPADPEPAWAVGGSYQVVRQIRMLVEFWDRVRINEQEDLIGRRKATGAPLDGEAETDVPDYAADPDGAATPLTAHIRLANPRTPETADDLMLRKGINYSRGFDTAGHLDQGLAFVSYQRQLRRFLAVQGRLTGEPLEEYIRGEGGGFFFALPGVPGDGFLGDGLFA